jgi:hypothetical protein
LLASSIVLAAWPQAKEPAIQNMKKNIDALRMTAQRMSG